MSLLAFINKKSQETTTETQSGKIVCLCFQFNLRLSLQQTAAGHLSFQGKLPASIPNTQSTKTRNIITRTQPNNTRANKQTPDL